MAETVANGFSYSYHGKPAENIVMKRVIRRKLFMYILASGKTRIYSDGGLVEQLGQSLLHVLRHRGWCLLRRLLFPLAHHYSYYSVLVRFGEVLKSIDD